MHKMIRGVAILSFFLVSTGAVYSQKTGTEFENINTGYALQYLEKAVGFYAQEDYRNALDYVKKGQSYDDSFSDFFYLEAVCLMKLGGSRALSVYAAEQAAVPGLHRHVFDEHEPLLLLARLYTETGRYQEAVRLLETVKMPSADRDYYYAAALYGMQQDERARGVITEALNRWSFDARFPQLFFLQERDKPVSRSGKKLADMLIRQLYVWTEQEPALAVYAAPFDPNPRENNRRLKVYRSMHKDKAYPLNARLRLASVLAELRYGVIDEKTAVQEFFAVEAAEGIPVKDGKAVPVLYSDQLVEFCRLAGMVSVRKTVAEQLKTFTGAVLEDQNNDGIGEAAVFFEKGRPVSAFFDINQDDVYEYRVVCNFGTPDRIFTLKNASEIQYDTYPAVRSVILHNDKKQYTMRPLAVKWEPLVQYPLDLRLEDTAGEVQPFFTLRLGADVRLLQEHDFIFSALYCDEREAGNEGTLIHTRFEQGRILSVEKKRHNRTESFAQYRNGLLLQKKSDYDGDGVFEILEEYNRSGQVQKISVDINKNKLFEYYEIYADDGQITKNWDENEDGSPEIQYIRMSSGEEKTVWAHRYSGKPVSVLYREGIPHTLTIGKYQVPLIKEPEYNLYWLELRPSFSNKVAQKLDELSKKSGTEVETFTVIIGNYELYAVRSAGALFVQVFPVSSNGE
ncbi:MAG: tetratricopeptide repeat protein [Treponema sp.]